MAFQMTLGTLGLHLALNAKAFHRGVKEAKGGIAGIAKGASIAGAALTGTMAAGMGYAVAKAAELEQALADAAAISGGDFAKTIGQFEAAARGASAGSVFSAKEAADGLKFMSMAGFSAAESMGSLNTMLRGATATNTALAVTSDIVTDVMGAMGMKAGDVSAIMDQMVLTTHRSNTNFTQLGLALSYAAPNARALGVSLAETNTAIAFLSSSGLKAERAGTGLRQLFARLTPTFKRGAKALRELGIKAFDSSGRMRPLADVIGQLEQAQKKLSPEAFSSKMKKAFGVEAATAMNVLAGVGKQAFESLQRDIENSGGAAERTAKLMEGTLHNQTRILKGNVENLASTLGQMFAPALKRINDRLTMTVKGVLESDAAFDRMKDIVIQLMKAGAGLLKFLGFTINLFGLVYNAVYSVVSILEILGRALVLAGTSAATGMLLLDDALSGDFSRTREAVKVMQADMDTLNKKISGLGGGLLESEETFEKMAAGVMSMVAPLENGALELSKMQRSTFSSSVSMHKLAKSADDAAKSTGTIRENLGEAADAVPQAMGFMAWALEKAKKDAEEMAKWVDEVHEKLDLGGVSKGAAERQAVMREAYDRMARAETERAVSMARNRSQHIAEAALDLFEGIITRVERAVGPAIAPLTRGLSGALSEIGPGVDPVTMAVNAAQGYAQGLAIAFDELIVQNARMQENIQVAGAIIDRLGIKGVVSKWAESFQPVLGLLAMLGDSLSPLIQLFGGGNPFERMAKQLFTLVQTVAFHMLEAGRVITGILSAVFSGLAGVVDRVLGMVGRFLPDTIAAAMASMSKRLNDRAKKQADANAAIVDAQNTIRNATMEDARDKFTEVLAETTSGFRELNEELKNAPSGFKATLDYLQYQNAQSRGANTMDASRNIMRTGSATVWDSARYGGVDQAKRKSR